MEQELYSYLYEKKLLTDKLKNALQEFFTICYKR